MVLAEKEAGGEYIMNRPPEARHTHWGASASRRATPPLPNPTTTPTPTHPPSCTTDHHHPPRLTRRPKGNSRTNWVSTPNFTFSLRFNNVAIRLKFFLNTFYLVNKLNLPFQLLGKFEINRSIIAYSSIFLSTKA